MMMAVWGILPSLSALGPLAFLALVAPAVFAVLSIWMRRWAAALTAASAMSAVYLVQGWWQPLLRPTWWSSRAGLWAVLGVIAAIAAGWALRRGNRFLPAVPSADSAFNPWWLAAIVLLSAGLIASVSASMPLALSVSLAAVLVGVTACAAYEFACRRAGRAGAAQGVAAESAGRALALAQADARHRVDAGQLRDAGHQRLPPWKPAARRFGGATGGGGALEVTWPARRDSNPRPAA